MKNKDTLVMMQPSSEQPNYLLSYTEQLLAHNKSLSQTHQTYRQQIHAYEQKSHDSKYHQNTIAIFEAYQKDRQKQLEKEGLAVSDAGSSFQKRFKSKCEDFSQDIKKIHSENASKVKKLENQLNMYKQKLELSKSQIMLLTQSQNEKKNQNRMLCIENEQLSLQIDKFKQRFKQRQQNMLIFSEKNSLLEQELRKKGEIIKCREAEIGKMKKQVEHNLSNTIQVNQKRILWLQSESARHEDDLAQLMKQMQKSLGLSIDQTLKLNIQYRQLDDLKKTGNAKLNKLSDLKQVMNSTRKNITGVVSFINKQLTRMNDGIVQYQTQNHSLQQSIQTLKRLLEQSKGIITKKDAQIRQYVNTIKTKTQQIQRLSGEKQRESTEREKQKKLKQALMTQKSTLQGRLRGQQAKSRSEQAKKLKAEGQNKILTDKNNILVDKINTLNIKVQRLQDVIREQKDSMAKMVHKQSELQAQIKLNIKQIEERGNKIKRLQAQVLNLQKDRQNNRRQIQKLHKFQTQLTDEIADRKKDIDDLNIELGNAKKTIDYLKDKKQALDLIQKEFVKQITHSMNGSAQIIDEADVNRSIDSVKEKLMNSYLEEKFFNNSEFIPKYKIAWIIDRIENFMYLKVKMTKIIYKYDDQNKTNFHTYFDKKENLLAIVKLCNGTIIGGFTANPFDPDRVEKPGKGFLFNLNRSKCYMVRDNPKLAVTTYDKFYFILGNSQIRIKSQQKKVFSNFGIALSTFNNGEDSKKQFLNDENQNELQIEGYEFYQIHFKAN